MRLLHTSDWHIGKVLRSVRRRPDHEAALAQVIGFAREERPDLIVHTGDVFDSFRPEYDDLQFALDRLRELAAIAPTIVLAGNHDSPMLFAILDRFLAGGDGRLRFIDRAREKAQGGVLQYPIGDTIAKIAPLPFYAPRAVDRFADAASWTGDYRAKIAMIVRTLGVGLADGYRPDRDVLIFAGHLHVGGAVLGNSERQSEVGEFYEASPDAIPPVSYAAFGHIHQPQKIAAQRALARYAGSLIPIDFGETAHGKSIVIVDATPGRPAEARLRDITAGRRLLRERGTIEALRARAADVGDAILDVVIVSEQPVTNHQDLAREIFPNATIVSSANDCAATRVVPLASVETAEGAASMADLFRAYLATEPLEGIDTPRVAQALARLDAFADGETPPDLDDLLGVRDSARVTA